MFIAIDPVEHSVCGLAGGVHKDYRSEVVGKQELGGGWRRIYLRLVDDMANLLVPSANRRRPVPSSCRPPCNPTMLTDVKYGTGLSVAVVW